MACTASMHRGVCENIFDPFCLKFSCRVRNIKMPSMGIGDSVKNMFLVFV